MPVIVISERSGSGYSTVGKLLAEKLNIDFFDVGMYQKSFGEGKETQRSIDVWKKLWHKKTINEETETLQRQKARDGNVVIVSKLGVAMIKDADLKVFLTAPKDIRAQRYANRDKIPIAEATKELDEKERLERESWKHMYGLDYLDQEKMADLVIDTSAKTPDIIVGEIITKLKEKKEKGP